MNFNVFAPKYPIYAQFGYNFSGQTDSGAGIACFCHSLVTSLERSYLSSTYPIDSLVDSVTADGRARHLSLEATGWAKVGIIHLLHIS